MRSWVEIDLDAIRSNINMVRDLSAEGVEILLPVKADGYGHGAVPVALEAERCGVGWFGVASVEEALFLRRGGIGGRLLLLTPPAGREMEILIAYSITPVVTTIEIAGRLNECAEKEGVVCPVHVEVDTGMGRTGVQCSQALTFIRRVADFPGLRVEGVFSHFSSADEEDISFTRTQLERFEALMRDVEKEVSPAPLIHISNSAGVLRIQWINLPMIRPGIFVYGVNPLRAGVDGPAVRPIPAMSFRSRIVFVKEVDAGVPIGYNRSYVSPERMKIATVSAGYRDGIPFGLSNRGETLIDGKRCPIVGNICMDMLMVDVSSIPVVRPGDRVTVLGADDREMIGAEEIARRARTISYDILTNLGSRVPRVYYRGGRPVRVTSSLGSWQVE
jgi:alanine racemase